MSEFDPTVTAYHEAGHILLAEWLGGRVIFASVIPSDESAIATHDGPVRSHGETRALWPHAESATQHENLAKVALAGPVAEMIYCDEQYEPRMLREWWTDWVAADEAIRASQTRQLGDQDRMLRLSRLVHELIEYFSRDEVWDRIAMVADHLEAHETLEQEQLDELRESQFFG